MLTTSFIPNFNLTKNEFTQNIGATNKAEKFYTYELSNTELNGRPKLILNDHLENQFYDHLPDKDEGLCLDNREAQLNPSRKRRELVSKKVNKLGGKAVI